MRRRCARLLTLAAAGALTASVATASAATEIEEFLTSGGETLRLKRLDSVECKDIPGLVRKLDASGYRKLGPRPPDDPRDARIYDYESRLSHLALEKCGARGGANN